MSFKTEDIPLFDPGAIENLRKVAGDEADTFVAEMAQLFLVEATRSIQDLRKSCDQGDWRAVGRVAHSVKSSAATLGLMRLSNACRALEFETRTATETDAAKHLAASVFTQFEEAIPTLTSLS
jgi:HPt (histidine-containing phosphotransfer) domain-containing protein